MKLTQALARRRNRPIWHDPVRRFRTLQSFSETEEDGGRDLEVAIRRVQDEELRDHLERHAKDERRHAELFRNRAAEVRALAADAGTSGPAISDKSRDLDNTRKADSFEAHGSFNSGIVDELGEVAYVAMLHVAEKRAAEVFTLHSELTDHDPETQAVFNSILKDEKYHVAYTGKMLDKFREQGRGKEVDAALKDAKSSRFMGAWKRLGIRSGAGFSKVLLLVMYWTLLLPFGLIASRTKLRGGWADATTQRSSKLSSQY